MKYIFEAAEHEEYGLLGWRLQGHPTFEPLAGMAVAHDMLEHFPNDQGTPEDELQALGASLLVRGETYFATVGRLQTSPAYQMQGELLQLYFWAVQNESSLEFESPGDVKVNADIDEILDDIITRNRETLESENLPDEDMDIFASPENMRRAKLWLAKGYNRALRRYKGVDVDSLPYLFIDIEKKADKLLKVATEGMLLTVKVNTKTLTAELSSDYSEEVD